MKHLDIDAIRADTEAYLAQHERKELLRFLTCGSVDDGKSTLIGRLLYDSKMVYEDQLAAVRKASARSGTTGGNFDPALLTDGLKAEREQGITIDVAYRYFSTTKRKFIIADTPGHEQYTRNMATGASNCDLAIILVDARHGVVTQTRRHSFIVSLLGIRHVIVAINKMDLVDYSEERYNEICEAYTAFAARLGVEDIRFLPLAALHGDNVVNRSEHMPWYGGSTCMHMLENIVIASDRNLIDFRMPVQYVNRPNLNFRGFAGTVASGVVRPGDEVVALPSRRRSRVKSIVTQDGELEQAFAPQAVTLTLEDEIDVSRGDVLSHPANQPAIADQLEAMLVWMAEDAMQPGKRYDFKLATRTVTGSVSAVRYRIDVNSLKREESDALELNAIGRCTVSLSAPVAYDAYSNNRTMGAFVVIDRMTNATVGAGMVLDRVREGGVDHWDTESDAQLRGAPSRVTPAEREARMGHKAPTLLLTGLTRAGKTTLAYALERRLFDLGHSATVLDGQNMRLSLNRDLGFNDDERSESLRRTAEVAHCINAAGVISIIAAVAPREAFRQRVAEVVGTDQLLTVHVDAPLEVCRERDAAGEGPRIYELADAGELGNFPGVSAPYEVPESPALRIDTGANSVDACVEQIVALLRERSII